MKIFKIIKIIFIFLDVTGETLLPPLENKPKPRNFPFSSAYHLPSNRDVKKNNSLPFFKKTRPPPPDEPTAPSYPEFPNDVRNDYSPWDTGEEEDYCLKKFEKNAKLKRLSLPVKKRSEFLPAKRSLDFYDNESISSIRSRSPNASHKFSTPTQLKRIEPPLYPGEKTTPPPSVSPLGPCALPPNYPEPEIQNQHTPRGGVWLLLSATEKNSNRGWK